MWKELSFEPEDQDNFKNISSTVDSVKFNQSHFDFYKKLCAIRNKNTVLQTGDLEFIKAEGKLLGYRRFNKKEEVLVFFNAGSESSRFKLPPKSTFVNLVTERAGIRNIVSVGPLESVILKRN
jgi:glycosidase